MFCSWIASISSLDIIFLLIGIQASIYYLLESWFLWKIKGNTAIVRQALLEVIDFWALSPITKISGKFGLLLALLSVVIFDVDMKEMIPDTLVSFDELIILELQYMVGLMKADDLFCKLEM